VTAEKIKVTHVITALPRGGAQSVLFQLLQRTDKSRFDMDVVSLADKGVVGEKIAELGISVKSLNMGRRFPNPAKVLRLARWLRTRQPDLVQTWLYHGDLVGGLAARLAGRPVLWNLRQSDLDPRTTRRATMLTAKTCARLSLIIPRTIVCCSQASRDVHTALGYDGKRMTVIGNGVDLDRYRPDTTAGAALRKEIGVNDGARLVGLVARFHPQKDHQTFLTAAAQVCSHVDDVHFVLCGEDVDDSNSALGAMIGQTGFADRFHLLGIRDDIPRVTGAFDVAMSSSSYGEGFPNVLLEALACGVPCVTTDVGDSARIAGSTGWVTPPGDAEALAAALAQALAISPSDLGAKATAARAMAEEAHSISRMIQAYESLYEATVTGP
jgi:glycosyltransferase involved in cell wall biosynthesis